MTDRDAMIQAICTDPRCDTPRLVFADFLEERGECDRAEFIRKPSLHCHGDSSVGMACGYHRKEDGALVLCDVCDELHRHGVDARLLGESVNGDYDKFQVRHGFISSLICSWSDWLRHALALFWNEKQVVECPNKCKPNPIYSGERDYVLRCSRGSASLVICGCVGGSIPKPFPSTAQPLEEVRLTTWPDVQLVLDEESIGRPGVGSFTFRGGTARFDRATCRTCDGTGLNRLRTPSTNPDWNQDCPTCHGTPLNKWYCDDWPGLVFRMPEGGA